MVEHECIEHECIGQRRTIECLEAALAKTERLLIFRCAYILFRSFGDNSILFVED
jgi:hypothetical protein